MTSSDTTSRASPPASEGSINTSKQDAHAVIKDAPVTANGEEPSTGAREFFALCKDLERRVNAFLEAHTPTCSDVDAAALKRTQLQTRRSLEVIQEALRRYSLSDLALSYNGGKDCLVLLLLYLAALPSHFTPSSINHTSTTKSYSVPTRPTFDLHSLPPGFPSSLAAVYIEAPHPFVEVDAFVASTSKAYHLALTRHAGSLGLRTAFASYLAQNPQLHAIFVGTRRSDPHGAQLSSFQPTDRGWPAFMRVHPVLEWRYEDVWVFLREMRIPYCELYDQGYTSLGGRLDTHPNPALRRVNAKGDVDYRPAHELVGDEAERLGRDQ